VTWTLGVIHSRALFQARLFLPGFVALIPLMAESIVRLSVLNRPGFSIAAFVRLTVGLVLALGLTHQMLGVLRLDPMSYLLGQESRSDYLRRVLGDHYVAMQRLEEAVPESGKVLFLWEPRSYFSPRPAQPDAILDTWAHLVYLHDNEARITEHLREEGYTHVLLNQRGLEFVIEENASPLSTEDVKCLRAFVKEYLRPVRTEGRYQIYELQG
jgi:hypothetical protein